MQTYLFCWKCHLAHYADFKEGYIKIFLSLKTKLFVSLWLWGLEKPEMDLVSIDYNAPVSGQVEILDRAVLVLLLSISLRSCSSSIVSKVQESLLKVIARHLVFWGIETRSVPTLGPNKYGDDCVSDVQRLISASRGGWLEYGSYSVRNSGKRENCLMAKWRKQGAGI